jgi:hypothetical protein
MFGNCLLVVHCSQNNRAANRAIARFLVVVSDQQENLYTVCPQMVVDGLGTVSHHLIHCRIEQANASGWPKF